MIDTRPFISVIMPVFREQETIKLAMERLAQLSGSKNSEIIVVDGDPEGGTIRMIDRAGMITAIAPKGRASQMNHGAALASGKVLLFLHADTLLPADAFNRIEQAVHADRCIAGAFDLGIDSPRWIFRITERYVALRTRLTGIPFGDQAIFIRHDYFGSIGGYRDIPLMEDVELMQRIKKDKGRISVVPAKVMTSPRRWEREGVFCCTLRNWMLQLCYVLGIPPEQLARWYRS
jgi:rSAM/selenodomain-associated transferase 2